MSIRQHARVRVTTPEINITELAKHLPGTADVAIILGSGLGAFADTLSESKSVKTSDIPGYPVSTVAGHAGKIVVGKIGNTKTLAFQGRIHMYEGYSLKQITLPVRVMRALGAELLLVTNACGGMNPNYRCGDLMLIDDHINLMGDNPLIGINDDRLGPRFPDMSEPYDRRLIDEALSIARREDIVAHRGVFVAVSGPNLETRAEYRFLRAIGSDVVGMSTVPEVIVARHAGLRVAGISIITDMCLPDALAEANVAEIIATANAAQPSLTKLVLGILDAEKRAAGQGS